MAYGLCHGLGLEAKSIVGVKYDLSHFHAFFKPDNLYIAKFMAGIGV